MTATSAVLGFWQDRDPLEALQTAQIADELGYPELWVGEMATFDAFALAAAIGARTRRIALTVGPLAVAVRDPMALAMGTASVAALANGDRRPVNLAIGTSSRVVVEAWHGRPWGGGAQRLRETARAVKPLLAGERNGAYRLRLKPPPAKLTVAAFGPQALDVAVRHGERAVINLATVDGAATLCRRLDAAAAAAGVHPPPLALWIPAAVDPGEEAVEQLTRALVPYLAADGYAGMFEAAGHAELVALARTAPHPAELLGAVPRDLCRAVGLVGTADEVAGRAAAYRDAGVDELAIVPATAGDPGGRRTLTALAPG